MVHRPTRSVYHRHAQPDRIGKSIDVENTFAADLGSFEEMQAAIQPIIDKVSRYCEQTGVHGRTVTLRVMFSDLQQNTRSRTLAGYVENRSGPAQLSVDLLKILFRLGKTVRLLGVSLSGLNTDEETESPRLLFEL